MLSGYLVQDIGAKGEKSMKNSINYTNEDMDYVLIEDFLPSPESLVAANETVKINLPVTKRSKDFFMNLAKENNKDKKRAGYQKIMTELLDQYALQHMAKKT